MGLGWALIGAVAGALGTLALVRKGTIDPYAANPSWGGLIRGEYWIDPSGQAEDADIDIGDKGHEAVAIDNLLDKGELIDGLIEYYEGQTDEYKEQYDVNDKLSELSSYRDDDEMYSSNIYFLEFIPDEVGIAAAGSAEIWKDVETDARLAYAKHMGAIQVVDTNFYSWKVTKDTLDRIRDFLYEMLEGEEGVILARDKTVWIEEGSTGRSAGLTVGELLVTETPRDLWALKATG